MEGCRGSAVLAPAVDKLSDCPIQFRRQLVLAQTHTRGESGLNLPSFLASQLIA